MPSFDAALFSLCSFADALLFDSVLRWLDVFSIQARGRRQGSPRLGENPGRLSAVAEAAGPSGIVLVVINLLRAESLGGAPSFSLFGAFFPAWLLCAGLGLLACFVLRGILIAIRFDDAVPLKLMVYLAFAVIAALGSWLALFGDR